MNAEVRLPIGLHDTIPSRVCGDPTYRLTVGMLICVDGKLLMLKSASANADGFHNWWTLPQEGFQSHDRNIMCAVMRGIHEELGFLTSDTHFHDVRVLGDMKNRVPTLRSKDGGCKKHIVFVGLRSCEFPIKLDTTENIAYQFVSSWDELDEAMAEVAEHRIKKYIYTCEMVNHACRVGLLPWKESRM